MKNRRISLLDIGLDSSFDAAMAFVQGVLRSVHAGYDEPVVDIDFVRSRDPDTVLAACLHRAMCSTSWHTATTALRRMHTPMDPPTTPMDALALRQAPMAVFPISAAA